MLHSLRLSFGNSRYGTMTTHTNGQADKFGGITKTGDGSALTTSPIAEPRTGWSYAPVNALVGSTIWRTPTSPDCGIDR